MDRSISENISLVQSLATLRFVEDKHSTQGASGKFNVSHQTIERIFETRCPFEENVTLH